MSGAGRPPKDNTTFCAVDENVTAYGLLSHRHTPEIEQALTERTGQQTSVLFTPHLAPLNRGILATCYARPTHDELSSADVTAFLEDFYRHEPFMVVSDRSPATKATLGSNSVTTNASNMPAAPSMLPRTAVRGWAMFFSPKMNSTAATR